MFLGRGCGPLSIICTSYCLRLQVWGAISFTKLIQCENGIADCEKSPSISMSFHRVARPSGICSGLTALWAHFLRQSFSGAIPWAQSPIHERAAAVRPPAREIAVPTGGPHIDCRSGYGPTTTATRPRATRCEAGFHNYAHPGLFA